jgi:biotin-[acetyl-CoA-carboxylase] ligase BirA-like protein
MIIYTDSKSYAERLFPMVGKWREGAGPDLDPALEPLITELYPESRIYRYDNKIEERWPCALIVKHAPRSQYDLLVGLNQRGVRLPDGVICLAGSGLQFHGQRGRPWSALAGNIHLSVSLAPRRPIERFHTGFSILAATALVEAIDQFDPLEGAVTIKWVNDLLIDGAKVAGFLAQTASVHDRVNSAVLGIGLNVETTPDLPADSFVPRAASLSDFMPDRSVCSLRPALRHVLDALDAGYGALLDGDYFSLLDSYRRRSIVVGRRVRVVEDTPSGEAREIAAGRVSRIGDDLELFLENRPEPILSGRLILEG